MDEKEVVFIDAYNLIYRAYHGNQTNLTNSEGLPTNAIYTVSKMLQKLPSNFKNLVHGLAVFDGGANFREEISADYKANRKPMPDDLRVQLPYIKEVFDIFGWSSFQAENVEADDVIGSLALRASKSNFKTYIISGDKDFRQLVTDNLVVWDTMQNIIYDRSKVYEKMGVYPENVVSYLSLLGDSSDNVRGVDKVGKGTAAKLLNQYGDMSGIKDNLSNISGKVGENLSAAFNDGTIDKNISLISLKLDLELKITAKDVRKSPVDNQRWEDFCHKMNFNSLLNKPKP